MVEKTILKKIQVKGNGQALIYITKKDLSELDLEIGSDVRINKVKVSVRDVK